MPINPHFIFAAKTQCSEQLSEWINYQYSLTDKLQKLKGTTELELIKQEWVLSNWWDKQLLQIKDKLVFQREIIMRSDGIAYWYARSIIPQKCYNMDPIFFKRLETESIKKLIFDDTKVRRLSLISYPVDHQCIEYYWVKKYINTVQDVLWVRLAEYSLQQKESFYLVELLLPELEI